MDNELRIAILIDADNVSDKYIKIIVDEVANIGIATYKRIYGDWTSARLSSWKKVLLEDSIIPIQQYSYTTGKNATDSAMIIDAMDILYSGNVDGYCIVSSDSDFTRLAARLRESGMLVLGMGEEKTPKPIISACNQFKYLDLLYRNQQEEEKKEEEKPGMDVEKKPEITYDDFAKLQFQVGEGIACEAVKKSKKLRCSQVKIGSQVRQIVSGIKAYYTPEEMVGKKVMVVTNLKPAKLAGILSEGMILCAEDAEGNVCVVSPEKNMPAGSEIC